MELSLPEKGNFLTLTYFRKQQPENFEKTPKAFLIFRETHGPKIFLVFQERHIQNPSITELFYISGKVYSEPWHNGSSLYFGKKYAEP